MCLLPFFQHRKGARVVATVAHTGSQPFQGGWESVGLRHRQGRGGWRRGASRKEQEDSEEGAREEGLLGQLPVSPAGKKSCQVRPEAASTPILSAGPRFPGLLSQRVTLRYVTPMIHVDFVPWLSSLSHLG